MTQDDKYDRKQEAEPLAEEIIKKIRIYMAYQMEKWPSENDVK